MELLLVKLFALLRPLLFLELDLSIGGLNLFELAAIAFVGMLGMALLVRGAAVKRIEISSVDVAIGLFVLWCTGAYLAYAEKAEIRDLVRLLLPFLTYTIAKNVIADAASYGRVLAYMMVGFTIPLMVTAVMLLAGAGVYDVNYWTGVPRYEGPYTGPHNMAHNMVFFLMLLAVFVRLDEVSVRRSLGVRLFWGVMAAMALYNLYQSATRTAMVGLMVFLMIYLIAYNRKALAGSVVALVLSAVVFSSSLSNLYYDFAKVTEGEWETENLGSGRLGRWQEQMEVYGSLHFDAQLAGVGVGNKVDRFALEEGKAAATDSHNDYMDVLMQTGAVGLSLFVLIQWLLFKSVLRIPGQEKYAFLAMFLAVAVMNFVSNSYVTRFGLGQMFFLVMAYVDIARRKREAAGPVPLEPHVIHGHEKAVGR